LATVPLGNDAHHKDRRKRFDAAALAWLTGHARQVFAKMDCRLLAGDGEADHLRILVELSVSVLVNAFKGTSSRRLRRNRPHIASCYRDDVLWRRLAALRGRSSSRMSSNSGSALPPRAKARGFRALKMW
jgi:REP element-mobilizing transposase RayT